MAKLFTKSPALNSLAINCKKEHKGINRIATQHKTVNFRNVFIFTVKGKN